MNKRSAVTPSEAAIAAAVDTMIRATQKAAPNDVRRHPETLSEVLRIAYAADEGLAALAALNERLRAVAKINDFAAGGANELAADWARRYDELEYDLRSARRTIWALLEAAGGRIIVPDKLLLEASDDKRVSRQDDVKTHCTIWRSR